MMELLKAVRCHGHRHGESVELDAEESHRVCRRTVFIDG